MSSNIYWSRSIAYPFVESWSQFVNTFELLGSNRVSPKQRHVCADEVIYDSLMPRIDEILSLEGATAAYLPTMSIDHNVGVYILSKCTVSFEDVSSSLGIDSRYSEWFQSYPFESKYVDLQRQKQFPSRYFAVDSNDQKQPVKYVTFEIIQTFEGIPLIDSGSQRRKIIFDKNLLTDNLLAPNNLDTYKFFFGFGDTFESIENLNPPPSIKQSFVNMPTFRYLDSTTDFSSSSPYEGHPKGLDVVIGPMIRGWKYGAYSAFPSYTSCVFRRSRFGQFRDMLEQRPFTVFSGDKYGKTSLSPVEIKFCQQVQSGTYNYREGSFQEVDPSQTNVLNHSMFATSSYPYTDG